MMTYNYIQLLATAKTYHDEAKTIRQKNMKKILTRETDLSDGVPMQPFSMRWHS